MDTHVILVCCQRRRNEREKDRSMDGYLARNMLNDKDEVSGSFEQIRHVHERDRREIERRQMEEPTKAVVGFLRREL
jgi:hypothetical protein